MSENRFLEMAENYDIMAPVMVPHYGFMQSMVLDYLRIEEAEQPVIVDLGAGSGTFLERILQRNRTAKCYYVDLSESFLNVAKHKLSRYNGHVDYITTDIEDGWTDRIPMQPDYIFSMSAIHHLESHGKQQLYQRCFDCLKPGGWFVNIDEMKTIYPDAYFNSLRYWERYCEEQGLRVKGAFMERYRKWRKHFQQWKERNINGLNMPKVKGDDIHESFILQMAWLKEIGFKQVDLFVKLQLWCIIGGKKPVKQD